MNFRWSPFLLDRDEIGADVNAVFYIYRPFRLLIQTHENFVISLNFLADIVHAFVDLLEEVEVFLLPLHGGFAQ